MNLTLYRVDGGTALIPTLMLVGITAEQFPAHAAVVETVFKMEGRYVVRALEELQFDPDEVIGLTAPPEGDLAAVLVEEE